MNNNIWLYQWGGGWGVAVWRPPHRPVNVDVLNEERHQQVEEEQRLEQQVTVQRKIGNTGMTDRFRSDEGREGRSQTHHPAAPATHTLLLYVYP